jgi:imidazolonepropionase-like amidohydrolase
MARTYQALCTLAFILFVARPIFAQTIVIQAEKVLTSTEQGTIGPTVVVVKDGKITSVSSTSPGGLPSDVVRLEASFLSPGLIDARTTLGLSGLIPADEDRDEITGPDQAHLRAIDAFDLSDPMLKHALRSGVTIVQSGPGKANSIGGQAGLFRTYAGSTEEATIRFPSAVVFSLTESAKMTYGKDRGFPSTRMANVGLIRQAFVDAEHYRKLTASDEPPDRDLKKEALALVLDGQISALVSAERVDEIATAMRLADEFGFELMIVGATDAHLLVDKLAGSPVPILLGPPGDAVFRYERADDLVELPSRLNERRVPFALVSGDDERAPRLSLLERAQFAIRGGLDPEQALKAITIDPARLLGIDDRVGSVETGKDADLVLYDGSPFSSTTKVVAVLVDGKIAYQR